MRALDHITGLAPPHFSACPKPGPEFPILHVVFNGLRREVAVHFVDHKLTFPIYMYEV
jgi:hypothetical protein